MGGTGPLLLVKEANFTPAILSHVPLEAVCRASAEGMAARPVAVIIQRVRCPCILLTVILSRDGSTSWPLHQLFQTLYIGEIGNG